jgi:diaminopimelate decarboxylase
MYSQSFVDRLIAWADEHHLSTPTMAVAPPVLRAGVDYLRANLGGRISYATKANPHPVVLTELAGLVEEFNVTNLAHLDQLLAMGVHPERIAWLHPATSPATLSAVADRGIERFVVDDVRGLGLLRDLGVDAAVTLRLRPAETGEAERSVVRFGAPPDELVALARDAVVAGLRVEALSFFVGTDTADLGEATPYLQGITELAKIHGTLAAEGIGVRTIVVGGGFPGCRRRFHDDHPGFFPRIREALEAAFGPDVDVLSEPGRYLAESAMVLLTRVIVDRTVAGRRFVHVDASAYGGLFESTFIEPAPDGLSIGAASSAGPAAPGELLGPIMDSFDVLQKGGLVPVVPEGELLVLGQVGAYSIGFTTQSEGVSPPSVVELPDDLAVALAMEWTS